MSVSVVTYAYFDKPLKLVIDASDIGTDGVLVQGNEEGINYPLGFYSKELNKDQKKYCGKGHTGLDLACVCISACST